MAIPETLRERRYSRYLLVTAAVAAAAAAVGVLRILPSFLTIIGFFAPLLISTALVLATVPVVARYVQKTPDAAADVVGGDILDFVVGGHEELPLLMPEELAPPPPLLDERPSSLMPMEEIAPLPQVEETPPQPPMKETPPPPPGKETPPAAASGEGDAASTIR